MGKVPILTRRSVNNERKMKMNETLFKVIMTSDKLVIPETGQEFYLPDSTQEQIESWLMEKLNELAREFAEDLAIQRPWRK